MHSEITNNNNDHQQATEERGNIFCFVLMILMFIHSLLLCSLFSASLHRQRSPCLPLTNHLLHQFTHLNTRPTERFLQCVLDLPWGLFLVVYAQNTFTQEGLKSHPVRWPNHLSCLLSMWLSSGAALSLS